MKSEPPETISLSFVDVITNGMGSLLVLFLLMTVIRENVNLGAPETPAVTAVSVPNPNAIEGGDDTEAIKDPFVILVSAGRRDGLFAGERTAAWVVPDDLRGSARTNTGSSFAALYAPRPPTAPVSLTRLRPKDTIVIRVSQSGKELKPRTVVVADDGTAVIWSNAPEPKP